MNRNDFEMYINVYLYIYEYCANAAEGNIMESDSIAYLTCKIAVKSSFLFLIMSSHPP